MTVIVNGVQKELRMLDRNGIDCASELATNYNGEKVDAETGLKLMSEENYDWFVDTFAKMEQVERALVSSAFTNLDENTRTEFWNLSDDDMDTAADSQLDWMREHGVIVDQKTVYELRHEQVEIGYVKFGAKYDFGDICGMNIHKKTDYYPEIVASFDNKEDALEELKQYNSDTWTTGGQLGHLLFAEEYWIEEILYDIDEDGELQQNQSEGVHKIAELYKRD